MNFLDKNLSNEHVEKYLKEDNGSAKISYGFNSGGYEKFAYFVTKTGGILGINNVKSNIHTVNFNDPQNPELFIVGSDINYEATELFDTDNLENIPPAYEKDYEEEDEEDEEVF